MVMTEQDYRNKTNAKIDKLYHMAEVKLKGAKTDQDVEIAKRMLIAGLDIATAATANAIQRNKQQNEFH